MKVEFSRQVFEKYSKIKSCETRSLEADLFHVVRHDEGNSRFSQFRGSF